MILSNPQSADDAELPMVGPLRAPDALVSLHHALITQASDLARHRGAQAGTTWATAADTIAALWSAWTARTHASAAQDAMRRAADQAVRAVLQALRADRAGAAAWFDLARGWTNELRMQAPPAELPTVVTRG